MALSLHHHRDETSLVGENISRQSEHPASTVRKTPSIGAKITAPVALLPPALGTLLDLETKIRAATTLRELQFLLANQAGAIGPDCRVIVLAASQLGKMRVVAAPDTARLEATAPLTRAYETLVGERISQTDPSEQSQLIGPFTLQEHENSEPRTALILPLRHNESMLGALLFISDFPWRETSLRWAAHLGDATAHAWRAHASPRLFEGGRKKGLLGFLGLGLVLLASLIPVPMTALAPMRVVTIDPMIIAAPIDGVIDDVLIKPNDAVVKGAPLIRYVELSLVAKAETAEREMAVAEAKFRRVSMVALSNLDAKRELAIIEAEWQLKRAERDFAVDQLRRSRVLSPVAGTALFGDRKDWIGRPVAAGERILELGDATRVELQLELPVEDAMAMQIGQPVAAFLDTAPLSPLSAEVTRINHEPRVIEGRGLAFVIHARILDGALPPLGVRGTAHIRGDKVPLGLFLLRRPISSFRQWAGV